MSASTTTVRDAKAGWCSTCRRGAHALCAAPGCECHRMGEDHPNRPEARTAPATAPVAAVPAPAKPKATKPPKAAPVWELVKATPPPTAKKQSPAELAQPMLEAILESEDLDWWRIALFGTPHAAGRVKAQLAEEFPEGWEWKSARDDEGRPAVFVRRVAE